MISNNSLALLEFHKLLSTISDFSHSDVSRESVFQLHPLGAVEEIQKRFGQINEIRRMTQEGSPLTLSGFSDIGPLLVKIRPEGAVLEPLELAGIIPVLTIASDISVRMKGRDDLPLLCELTNSITGFPDILKILKKSVDTEGNILDTASALLFEIRGEIKRLEARIRKKLEEMVRDEKVAVFLQDTFITNRSGRWVIPVRMDSKGQVNGVVHDVSKSGETAFIEPLSIIHLSNELENIVAEQKAEEIRILKNICNIIRAVAVELSEQFSSIVYLDVLCCIARFADMLHMETPQINDSGIVNLVKARHPLLVLAFQNAEGHEVVPLDIRLGKDANVMVITGANAGGKTIAIKTVGLLLAMALSGMPVPADSSSGIPFVNDLLIDIGDEQSIEMNLSTFSAHISKISGILNKARADSVVLIDELGTGTDPEEGAALACSILQELRERGSLVFATTHLSDIKGFVYREEGMINASMEFDESTLNPLYRLRVGEPGQSHALEIAKRYGLSEKIITTAKGMLGGLKLEFDRLISDLNAKRAEYEKEIREIRTMKADIEDRKRLLEKELTEAKDREKDIISKAYKEASEIISETKRQMNSMIEELKKKEKEKRREAIKQVEAVQKQIADKVREYETDAAAPSITGIKEGDTVFIRSLGYDASVIEIHAKQNRLKVRAGSLEIEVPLNDIGFKKGKTVDAGPATKDLRPDEIIPSRINMIGLRVDEALSRLEPFINHASLAGFSEITVIHGIGKGLLMKAVHEHLTGHPLIKGFRKGEQAEGGAGVTIATLK